MTYDERAHLACTMFHHLVELAQQQNPLQQDLNLARSDFRNKSIDESTLLGIASACDYEEARLFVHLLDAEETDALVKASIQQLYSEYAGIHTDLCMALIRGDDEDYDEGFDEYAEYCADL